MSTTSRDDREWVLTQAIQEAKTVHGADHPRTAVAFAQLADHLLELDGRTEEALSLYSQARCLLERAGGEFFPLFGTVYFNLSVCYRRLRRSEEAKAMLEKAVKLCQTHYGPADERTLKMELDLGVLLVDHRFHTEAENLLKESIQKANASLGPDHWFTGRLMFELSSVLIQLERETEAEPLLRQVIAIDEKCHGSDHLELAPDLNDLAMILEHKGRGNEAESLFVRSIRISRTGDARNLSTTLANYADLLVKLDRLEEAQLAAREALDPQRQHFGERSLALGTRLRTLANVLSKQGNVNEAEAVLRWWIHLAEDVSGPSSTTSILAWDALASFFRENAQWDGARQAYMRAIQLIGEARPAEEDARMYDGLQKVVSRKLEALPG